MPLTIQKRQAQNKYFEEILEEGVLPLRMMQIPAGSFLMGSPKDELERTDAEGPQHKVSIAQFYMAKYPVTQGQWRVVAAMPQINRELKSKPSFFKGEMRPVEHVSWYDAVEFCDRLSAYTKRHYRLPSEAEWEYACRAGTATPFHFGETISTDYANYRGTDDEENDWSGSYGDGPKGEYREETTPVDFFEGANDYGLCGMHDNVSEWCLDDWHETYENAPDDGSAWIDPNALYKVWRGGSWNGDPRHCRSAVRNGDTPGSFNPFLGFRVCCSPPRILQ